MLKNAKYIAAILCKIKCHSELCISQKLHSKLPNLIWIQHNPKTGFYCTQSIQVNRWRGGHNLSVYVRHSSTHPCIFCRNWIHNNLIGFSISSVASVNHKIDIKLPLSPNRARGVLSSLAGRAGGWAGVTSHRYRSPGRSSYQIAVKLGGDESWGRISDEFVHGRRGSSIKRLTS